MIYFSRTIVTKLLDLSHFLLHLSRSSQSILIISFKPRASMCCQTRSSVRTTPVILRVMNARTSLLWIVSKTYRLFFVEYLSFLCFIVIVCERDSRTVNSLVWGSLRLAQLYLYYINYSCMCTSCPHQSNWSLPQHTTFTHTTHYVKKVTITHLYCSIYKVSV